MTQCDSTAVTSCDHQMSFWALWEGKVQGEGVIPSIKAELTMGLRRGWPYRLLTKVSKRKDMKLLMEQKAQKIHESDAEGGSGSLYCDQP